MHAQGRATYDTGFTRKCIDATLHTPPSKRDANASQLAARLRPRLGLLRSRLRAVRSRRVCYGVLCTYAAYICACAVCRHTTTGHHPHRAGMRPSSVCSPQQYTLYSTCGAMTVLFCLMCHATLNMPCALNVPPSTPAHARVCLVSGLLIARRSRDRRGVSLLRLTHHPAACHQRRA